MAFSRYVIGFCGAGFPIAARRNGVLQYPSNPFLLAFRHPSSVCGVPDHLPLFLLELYAQRRRSSFDYQLNLSKLVNHLINPCSLGNWVE